MKQPLDSPGHCGCLNHGGGKKQMFKTREAAVEQVISRHLRKKLGSGVYKATPCKRREGIWHVTSKSRANQRSAQRARRRRPQ